MLSGEWPVEGGKVARLYVMRHPGSDPRQLTLTLQKWPKAEASRTTTGQGEHTYVVTGIRRTGDSTPPPPDVAEGEGRLTLVTGLLLPVWTHLPSKGSQVRRVKAPDGRRWLSVWTRPGRTPTTPG